MNKCYMCNRQLGSGDVDGLCYTCRRERENHTYRYTESDMASVKSENAVLRADNETKDKQIEFLLEGHDKTGGLLLFHLIEDGQLTLLAPVPCFRRRVSCRP